MASHQFRFLCDTTSACSPARTVPAAYVIADAENIDRTLGGLYGRRPRGEERPRWERLPDFVCRCFGTDDVRAFMVLAARETPQFTGFVEMVPEFGFEPITLNPEPGVEVVDLAIQRMLRCIPPHSDLIVISHDGGYLEALKPAVTPGRRVAVIGFVEQLSHVYREHGQIELFDLEHDIAAFDVSPPRKPKSGVDLDDFDPDEFM